MAEFILNPRRAPRIPARCDARIALRTARFFASVTFDVGPGGCGLEAPWKIEPGERVFVELQDIEVFGSHVFAGRVAWASDEAPWRCGIAFDAASAHAAAALFEDVEAANPSAAAQAQLVEPIPADAVLSPTPLPGDLAAVVPAEAEVLRAIGSGVDARTLRQRLGARWDPCLNALFSLLGRRVVEVSGRLEDDAAARGPTDRA